MPALDSMLNHWNQSQLIDTFGCVPTDVHTWSLFHVLTWGIVVIGGLEILSVLVLALGPLFNKIPVQGKHLDRLAFKGP